ncbi:glutathione peroxidase [Salipaludibacillus sp. HK11]|uniref:glutathione peroxidase n=1 Tax=Salipaludibacillus sp. HK11 TaxID=3394320 RepID=UPI0039FC1F0A
MSIYDISVRKSNGDTYSLDKYKGKTMLIVNTATKCGLKGQFDSLESLYNTYKDKDFVVLGFPSDQFGQEVDNAVEAEQSCRMSYGVTFPMHDLIKVNGKDADPLFKYLTKNSKGMFGKKIKWNFTKFLINKEGNIVQRFGPKDKPESFENDIIKELT